MSQIVYIDGTYAPYAHAHTHIEDRGYQFSDAVYEGIGYIDGQALDADGHYARLEESLGKLAISMPMPMSVLRMIVARIIVANHIRTGFVYIQISRGVAPREHSSFGLDCAPVVVVMAKHQAVAAMQKTLRNGIRIGFMPDLRWQRCDIKTTGLLANCMAKTVAQSQGYDDAWLVDADERVTEGTASNAWIVDDTGTLRTRHLSQHILRGITRMVLLDMLDDVVFSEIAFTPDEARNAKEAFITSASMAIRPVVMIDGCPVADGKPGRVTRCLQTRFMATNNPALPGLLGLDMHE